MAEDPNLANFPVFPQAALLLAMFESLEAAKYLGKLERMSMRRLKRSSQREGWDRRQIKVLRKLSVAVDRRSEYSTPGLHTRDMRLTGRLPPQRPCRGPDQHDRKPSKGSQDGDRKHHGS